jgi:Domain of unknown function (DUF397)
MDMVFRKSSYCGASGCVEVAHLDSGQVALRDSKNVEQPGHVFSPTAWTTFTAAIKAGQYDLV